MSEKTTLGRLTFWFGLVGLLLMLLLLLYFFILASPATQSIARAIAPPTVNPYLKAISTVVIAVSAALAVLAIVLGISGLIKRRRRGALAGLIFGAVWLVLVVALIALGWQIVSALKGEKKLVKSEYEKYQKCRENQEQLELIINEFWKADHPDASEEETLGLNLGVEGDVVSFKLPTGQVIHYTGDMTIYDCPCDGSEENPQGEDIDYAVDYIDDNRYVHVKCIDGAGVSAGHNEEGLEALPDEEE